jgi:hypothetical protein
MGEVYRAHDSRLRRDVAIKPPPCASTNDSSEKAAPLPRPLPRPEEDERHCPETDCRCTEEAVGCLSQETWDLKILS